MTAQILAYIRISRPSQKKESQLQLDRISAAFPGHKIQSEIEISSGGVPLTSRPGFRRLLNRAKESGFPIIISHPDRLQKSLNDTVIHDNWNYISRSGVEFRCLHNNTEFHQHLESLIWRFGAAPAGSSHLTRVFVRILDQQSEHRQRLLNNPFATVKSARKYSAIKKHPYLADFRKIAKLIISQADHPRNLRRFLWDAFFGSAYNTRYIKHGAVSGHARRVGIGTGQLLTLPQDHRVAAALLRLEQDSTAFADGRPRSLSNAEIAHGLNALGLRNRLGNRFSRELVFHFRRHPAYRAYRESAAPTVASAS